MTEFDINNSRGYDLTRDRGQGLRNKRCINKNKKPIYLRFSEYWFYQADQPIH